MNEPAEVDSPPVDDYPAIGDYGLIGDCRTAALVSRDGAIEWCCFPHFSGPSVFAALLDRVRGGRFAIRPRGPYASRRGYRNGTAILVTTFDTRTGSLEVTDAMPIFIRSWDRPFQPEREILRWIRCISGEVEVEIDYSPRPEYATVPTRLYRRGRLGWACSFGASLLHLHTDFPLESSAAGDSLHATVHLRAGDSRYCSLTYTRSDIGVMPPLGEAAEGRLRVTDEWWRSWSNRCSYGGAHADLVKRSAITLKLLTHTLSGSIVAAPTTSLPEKIGGVRNWDYRYCWLRDAALTLRAFTDLNYSAEGEAFLGWLLHATRLTAPQLQVMYDVYGEVDLKEQELPHLDGYRKSRPVRIGNAASRQLQLDIYGEFVLAAYDYIQRGGRLDRYERKILAGTGEVVFRLWKRPDKGLWESRGTPAHHTHSKMMCWVVLERLSRLSRQGHLRVPERRYRTAMQEIEDTIEARGYNTRLKSYVGELDTSRLDAAVLLLSRYGYRDPNHPRMRDTFEAVDRALGEWPSMYRYRHKEDNLPSGEGTFAACGFWAVDYLARAGRIDEAEARFAAMFEHGNDLGLFAEEYDPGTGAALGNFPQAFTHVGLITAALSLSQAKGECHFEE